jgi:hypothetical protein
VPSAPLAPKMMRFMATVCPAFGAPQHADLA